MSTVKSDCAAFAIEVCTWVKKLLTRVKCCTVDFALKLLFLEVRAPELEEPVQILRKLVRV
jgi:hypothetical protein